MPSQVGVDRDSPLMKTESVMACLTIVRERRYCIVLGHCEIIKVAGFFKK